MLRDKVVSFQPETMSRQIILKTNKSESQINLGIELNYRTNSYFPKFLLRDW